MHASIIGRQFCVKCNEQRDHVRFGRRIEPSKTPDTTFIWAEFWNCDHCGNHLEKREERPWPTDRDIITKRLLKVATDYEQVKASHLEVEHARIVLTRATSLAYRGGAAQCRGRPHDRFL